MLEARNFPDASACDVEGPVFVFELLQIKLRHIHECAVRIIDAHDSDPIKLNREIRHDIGHSIPAFTVTKVVENLYDFSSTGSAFEILDLDTIQ